MEQVDLKLQNLNLEKDPSTEQMFISIETMRGTLFDHVAVFELVDKMFEGMKVLTGKDAFDNSEEDFSLNPVAIKQNALLDPFTGKRVILLYNLCNERRFVKGVYTSRSLAFQALQKEMKMLNEEGEEEEDDDPDDFVWVANDKGNTFLRVEKSVKVCFDTFIALYLSDQFTDCLEIDDQFVVNAIY